MRKCFSYIFGFVLISALLAYFHFGKLAHGQLHVYFLDVGQGDAVLLKTPSDKLILVDGGPDNEILMELNDVLSFFERKIDLVVLTHPHSDHIEGLIPVFEKFDVGVVLMTGVSYENAYYDVFLDEISDDGTIIYFADSNNDFYFDDGVFIDVLYPFFEIRDEKSENLNNSSIVMKISYKDYEILLAGDAEAEVEDELVLNGADLDSDLFKASHHGSKTSNSYDFLKAISPNYAVISCGLGNDFKHPHKETFEIFSMFGVEVFQTDLDGRVEFTF